MDIFFHWSSPNRLTLRVLLSLAGLAATVLLPLYLAGIPREEAGFLQGKPVFFRDTDERTGDPEANRLHLTGVPSPSDTRLHIVLTQGPGRVEREFHIFFQAFRGVQV